MPGYTIWTEHGQQPISQPTMEYAYDTADGLDQMLVDFGDAMHTDSVEDEPTADAKAFYALLGYLQQCTPKPDIHSRI